MRRFLTANGLGLFFLALFLISLAGQAVAGYYEFNDHQTQHEESTLSFGRYVLSSDFGADMLENWQSEWLQFWVFALATVWLIQKGSNESKRPEDVGLETDKKQRVGEHAPPNAPRWAKVKDWRLTVYSNSFFIVMGLVFLTTWLAQSFASWTVFNDEQSAHADPGVSWFSYLGSADFWERSLQNW